ncbi:MAG: hypothetical protein K6B51_02795 [Bacilli bacterium]|nr:hypothetical protein [Bacilli bacterium]
MVAELDGKGFSEDDFPVDELAFADGLAEEGRAEEGTRSEEVTFGTLEATEEDVSPTHEVRQRARQTANKPSEFLIATPLVYISSKTD